MTMLALGSAALEGILFSGGRGMARCRLKRASALARCSMPVVLLHLALRLL